MIDCTSSMPSTPLTASSIGRVMVTSIWSIGITPLSTPMMTRGKFVVGKTAIGIRESQVGADERQRDDQENDRFVLAREPVGADCGGELILFHRLDRLVHECS